MTAATAAAAVSTSFHKVRNRGLILFVIFEHHNIWCSKLRTKRKTCNSRWKWKRRWKNSVLFSLRFVLVIYSWFLNDCLFFVFLCSLWFFVRCFLFFFDFRINLSFVFRIRLSFDFRIRFFSWLLIRLLFDFRIFFFRFLKLSNSFDEVCSRFVNFSNFSFFRFLNSLSSFFLLCFSYVSCYYIENFE